MLLTFFYTQIFNSAILRYKIFLPLIFNAQLFVIFSVTLSLIVHINMQLQYTYTCYKLKYKIFQIFGMHLKVIFILLVALF